MKTLNLKGAARVIELWIAERDQQRERRDRKFPDSVKAHRMLDQALRLAYDSVLKLLTPWQPIATAPLDGRPINVWLGAADAADAADADFYCVPGTRFSAGWHWHNGKFRPIGGLPGIPVFVQPTHWMQVPRGPEAARP